MISGAALLAKSSRVELVDRGTRNAAHRTDAGGESPKPFRFHLYAEPAFRQSHLSAIDRYCAQYSPYHANNSKDSKSSMSWPSSSLEGHFFSHSDPHCVACATDGRYMFSLHGCAMKLPILRQSGSVPQSITTESETYVQRRDVLIHGYMTFQGSRKLSGRCHAIPKD